VHQATCARPHGSVHATHAGASDLWAIVLAGAPARLRETLERVALLIRPERIVLTTMASHTVDLDAAVSELPDLEVLAQPMDRGTAAAVLLAAHRIAGRDPGATIAVFPTDHFVGDETAFMRQLASVAAYVQAHPEWLVLLGARPCEPDAGHHWIEPGDHMGFAGGEAVYRIRGLFETSAPEDAQRMFERGCLWNTSVFAATADALIRTGIEYVPLLHDRLARLDLYLGTRYQDWALRQAYEFAPTADFSRAILECCPGSLAVSAVPALTWVDLRASERLSRALEHRRSPAWWSDTTQRSA
jgi:mannose-1-phosphate guanylyltransferase